MPSGCQIRLFLAELYVPLFDPTQRQAKTISRIHFGRTYQLTGMVQYVLNFFGVFGDNDQFAPALNEFSKNYQYKDASRRIRYIVFANKPDSRFQGRGVTYITYRDIITFLVEVRGQCWLNSGIGVASEHQQWNETIRKLFKIANDQQNTTKQKIENVTTLLN